MNSPQSQNEIVGATVIRNTIVEMTKTIPADTRCQRLKFIGIRLLMVMDEYWYRNRAYAGSLSEDFFL
jgi:hypothetical protein